jgi:hypothetical protein
MKEESAVSPVIGVMLMMVVTIVIAAIVSGLAGDLGDIGAKTGPTLTLSDPVMDVTATAPTTNNYNFKYRADQSYDRYKKNADGVYEYDKNGSNVNVQLCSIEIPVLEDTGDYYGLIFTSLGGDAFDIKNLQVTISSNNLAVTADYDSTRKVFRDRTTLIISSSALETAGLLDDSTGLPTVTTGDSFAYTKYSGSNDKYRYEYNVAITGLEYGNGTSCSADDLEAAYEDYLESVNGRSYLGCFHKIDPESTGDTIIRPGDSFEIALDSCRINAGGNPTNSARDFGFSVINNGIIEGVGIERGDGNEWVISHKPSGAILASGPFEFTDT